MEVSVPNIARNSTLVSPHSTNDSTASVDASASVEPVATISQRLLTHRVVLTTIAIIVGLSAGLGAGALFN